MAAICTATISPTGCDHRNVTVVLDGVSHVLHLNEADVLTPLTFADEETFILLSLRRMRAKGIPLSQLLTRCAIGDEATNVKQYDFFGPGAAITKTNIGVNYVNIPPGLNGEWILVDLTACTQFRLLMTANLIGVGPFGLRVVRDSDNVVLAENANLVLTGERELDTDWSALPAAFIGQGQTKLRVQGKSVTAADDPVFRRCSIQVR